MYTIIECKLEICVPVINLFWSKYSHHVGIKTCICWNEEKKSFDDKPQERKYISVYFSHIVKIDWVEGQHEKEIS